MDLPASVAALGEQLREDGAIAPDPALFCDADVFAAERQRIFPRPLMAVDHETRLAKDGDYFRCDAVPRPLVVTRESGGRLHALRNVCLHAGYPICEAQEGTAERLVCLYHGWEYTLDGRLVEPELSSRIDPARLRLASYSVWVRNGLILVDPSGETTPAAASGASVPAWLADAVVIRRARHSTTRNWKFLRYFLGSSRLLFGDEPAEYLEFGPLSFMFAQTQRAVLLRLVPRFAAQTEIELIEMMAGKPFESRATASDALSDELAGADGSLCWFDRGLAEWYWSMMRPPQ